MTERIPDAYRDLFERPIYVIVTTLMPDGQPQSTVLWVDLEGDYVRLNTARGRQKDKNLARDPRLTVVSVDPDDPYRWIEVRGVAEVITEEGAVDHINQLSLKYRGRLYYSSPEEQRRETRLLIKVRPTHVVVHEP